MTEQELNEYAAVEIMGWEAEGSMSGVLEDDYYLPSGIRVIDWHPSQDRNQLWLVLKEFLAWRSSFQPHTVSSPHPVIERIAGIVGPIVGVIHGSHTTKQQLYRAAMESPALALKAIVESHRGLRSVE